MTSKFLYASKTHLINDEYCNKHALYSTVLVLYYTVPLVLMWQNSISHCRELIKTFYLFQCLHFVPEIKMYHL